MFDIPTTDAQQIANLEHQITTLKAALYTAKGRIETLTRIHGASTEANDDAAIWKQRYLDARAAITRAQVQLANYLYTIEKR